jgi:hypothetical protein
LVKRKKKRVQISSSEEEEIEFLNKTLSSFVEENFINQKTKSVLRLLSSDSESENGDQDVSQS